MKQIVTKTKFLKVLEIILAGFIVLAPVAFVAAQRNINDPTLCQGTGLNCQQTNATALIKTVINWLLGIALAIAVLFLIVGGFWYITSAGNEETAEKGKGTVINAIIGIVIIILSWVIINVVATLVTTNTGP